MSSALVQLKGASKVYGCPPHEILAVDRASLDLEAGRFAVLAGPSGCGKTTLLMMAGCLLRPTSGEIRICGEDVTRMGEASLPGVRARHIGFIFQGCNLFPALTALENVELALNLKGVRGARARSRALEVLGRVGLERRVHHLPADMSGGEKQRVAIARALAGDPEILLADEPTAALDSDSGRRVVEILKEASQAADRLVLVVSHDERILPYADEVWRMEDGRLWREGGGAIPAAHADWEMPRAVSSGSASWDAVPSDAVAPDAVSSGAVAWDSVWLDAAPSEALSPDAGWSDGLSSDALSPDALSSQALSTRAVVSDPFSSLEPRSPALGSGT